MDAASHLGTSTACGCARIIAVCWTIDTQIAKGIASADVPAIVRTAFFIRVNLNGIRFSIDGLYSFG